MKVTKTSTAIFAIQPNVLLIRSDDSATSSFHDFTALPYSNGKHDVSPDTPFLSESIASQPLDMPSTHLQRGIHLHWTLPSLLRRSIALPVLSRSFLSTIMPFNTTEEQNEIWEMLCSETWEITNAGESQTIKNEFLQCIQKDTLLVKRHFDSWRNLVPEKVKSINGYPLLEARFLGHGADGKSFPTVPNRWMIIRSIPGKESKKWIIESDYIHPVSFEPEHLQKTHFTSFPWYQHLDENENKPFRYIGRSLELKEGIEKESAGSSAYLSEKHHSGLLTAMGYGDPSFSAFYPNCRSVFGFCDSEITDHEQLEGLEYQIVGYYSESENDYWSALLNYYEDEAQVLSKQKEHVKARLKERFGLELGDADAREMVCYAKVKMNFLASLKVESKVDLTFANSGTEAISAKLGALIVESEPAFDPTNFESNQLKTDANENLIESILMDDRLAGRSTDLRLKFQEFRHEQEFHSVNGGLQWIFQTLTNKDEKPPDDISSSMKEEVSIPLFQKLSLLNALQKEHNELAETLRSIQRETFTDWHLYMQCLYPAEGTLDHFPQADQLKDHMESVNLPLIDDLKAKSGVLYLNYGAKGEITGGITHPGIRTASVATQLAQKTNELVADLQGTGLGLYRIPASRYHIPKDPAICLRGESLTGLLHSQSTTGVATGFLVTETDLLEQLRSLSNTEVSQELFMNTVEKMVKGFDEKNKFSFDHFLSPVNAFNPLYLDWEINFFPVKGEKKPTFRADHYDEEYITSNFELLGNQAGLRLKKGKGLVSSQSERIQGRSILDPFSAQEVKNKLRVWLQRQLEMGEKERSSSEIKEKLDAFESPIKKELGNVLTALQKLEDQVPMLTQSLSGLNHALTGQHWAWQLPVADPLGYKAYQQFAEKVRMAVDRETLISPLPFHDFHPLRSGEVQFQNIRLVDSFGQYRDLPFDQIHGTKEMREATEGHLRLPVRILQESRINFRWINKELTGHESQDADHTSPIAGWVLPEFLERQIVLFDENGTALGRFRNINNTLSLLAMNADVALDPLTITEPSLQKFAIYLLQYGEKEGDGINDLLKKFHYAAEQTEPETAQDDDFVGKLFGRPLAIVHARLSLELKGRPIFNGSWDESWRKLNDGRLSDASNGFTKVKIPVRIGEYHQLNDGVCCWWEWENETDNSLTIKKMNFPQEEVPVKNGEAAVPPHLETFLEDEARHIGMLFNPFGQVHISCGLLPVKSISLPAVHYQKALAQLNGRLFVGPLITSPDHLSFTPPRILHHQWKWIDPEASSLNFKEADLNRLPEALMIREGWLQLEPSEENEIPKTTKTD